MRASYFVQTHRAQQAAACVHDGPAERVAVFGVAADEGCDRGRTDIAPACVFYDAGAVQICRPRHRVMELKRVEGGREGAGQCDRGCCHGVSC
ncbi:hypothetical protein G6F35_018887 [Rhizopus arrhizus]|nr:hypothetical protein G6F35_018887 [Rhizopus arrhizus]